MSVCPSYLFKGNFTSNDVRCAKLHKLYHMLPYNKVKSCTSTRRKCIFSVCMPCKRAFCNGLLSKISPNPSLPHAMPALVEGLCTHKSHLGLQRRRLKILRRRLCRHPPHHGAAWQHCGHGCHGKGQLKLHPHTGQDYASGRYSWVNMLRVSQVCHPVHKLSSIW